MPRTLPLLVLLAIPVGGLLVRRPPTAARAAATISAQERARAIYLRDLDTLEAAIARLSGAAKAHRDQAAQRAFRQARAAYKRIEYRVAYEMPEAEVEINGAPLPRVNEYASDGVLPPAGLQVIEAVLFPEPAAECDSVVAAQIKLMGPTLARLRKHRPSGVDRDAWLFDALRQELARVSTLGLAGFDATVTGDGIRESAEALRGVRQSAAIYEPDADPTARTRWAELDRRLGAAIAELEGSPDFDRFDRLGFLVRHAAPIARALTGYQSALGVARIQRPHTWSGETNTIFDAGAIDPVYYAPSDLARDPKVVALGRRLFFSSALSARGTRACATCHQPGRAFTDGQRLARTDPGPGRVRNTPTLLHASVQPFQFADQRARSLEDQVAVVMANPREMNQPIGAAVARLRQDTAVAREFAAAFGEAGPGALTERRLQLSIAAFVRSLPGFASRFDRAVQGDTTALTGSERRGFDLFMGKAACATCHFAPVFGGALPPTLLESEPEVIGVPSRPDTADATIDPDPGVAGFDHATIHRHAFKTPSLRNVELTAPYMHNGVYRTLEDVVDFYDRGGGAGIGIALPNQTLSPEPLRLGVREKRDLIAFMRALTDTTQVARR
jgi:cytochrome c peroxidase